MHAQRLPLLSSSLNGISNRFSPEAGSLAKQSVIDGLGVVTAGALAGQSTSSR